MKKKKKLILYGEKNFQGRPLDILFFFLFFLVLTKDKHLCCKEMRVLRIHEMFVLTSLLNVFFFLKGREGRGGKERVFCFMASMTRTTRLDWN